MLTAYVIVKASSWQEAISSYVFGESKVMHGFLTAWGLMPLISALFKGQPYVYIMKWSP